MWRARSIRAILQKAGNWTALQVGLQQNELTELEEIPKDCYPVMQKANWKIDLKEKRTSGGRERK